ncbi:MAG: glycerol kinase GlpK [Lachnospiraceae bacterium]|nr:glycerol kinase GlpK [Lachnospiraceae bacterium]
MGKYIIALDQGTTSSRCIIFDKKGDIISSAAKEFRQIFPESGWVEQDPNEIWASQFGVMMEAYAFAGIEAADVDCIGIANQRETTIVWDRETGEPVYNAIVWQCRRTAPYIEKLRKESYEETVRSKTGLILDPYFSGTKIKWILDNVADAAGKAAAGRLMFGTVDTWLLYKLTKGKVHATDYTNASRTMLFNIHTLKWDTEILDKLGIPGSMLPEAHPSSFNYGETDASWFGRSIPITGVAGDQQAALFGQCCFEPGDTKNTYGTGCFLLMNTGDTPVRSDYGLVTTLAASADGGRAYALEGSVFVAGAAIKWLRDDMHMIKSAAETEKIAATVPDTGGVYVVPAFTGLGAPYWDAYARGAVFGLTRGTTSAHFVRAVLESLAYESMDVIRAMEEDAGIKLSGLRVDGGASENDFLMQFQADILGAEIYKPRITESTALGAAYLAGLATGFYKDKEEIKANWELSRTFKPDMYEEVRKEKVEGWKDAVRRVR